MNPLTKFHADRARARAERDPCAEICALATVNAEGAPEVRTLVLRDIEDSAKPGEEPHLAVFINDSSPKWPAMTRVSALAYFPVLKVQYRLSCATAPVSETLVHSRWQERPEAPKKMDWYYTQRPQSSVVSCRDQLIEEVRSLTPPEPLVAPPSARGLYLVPFGIERLDLNQPDGIHDRRCWRRPASGSPGHGEPPKPAALAITSDGVSASDWKEAVLVP